MVSVRFSRRQRTKDWRLMLLFGTYCKQRKWEVISSACHVVVETSGTAVRCWGVGRKHKCSVI